MLGAQLNSIFGARGRSVTSLFGAPSAQADSIKLGKMRIATAHLCDTLFPEQVRYIARGAIFVQQGCFPGSFRPARRVAYHFDFASQSVANMVGLATVSFIFL